MPSSPSLSTIKKLFAKSSNRCAFPKCTVDIVKDDVLLGCVCHIKGAKPGSARYDALQNDSERHSEINLVILCPNHHSVVDDDAETYTVERLLRIKAVHEERQVALDSTATEVAATFLLSPIVSSASQSGGITSGTMNVGTLNISSTPSSPITTEREVRSIEELWDVIRKLRDIYSDVFVAESILTPSEIEGYFLTGDWPPSLTSLTCYCSFEWGVQQLARSGANDSDRCRLYVSDRLWGIFATIRALYGRLGVLYHFSFEQNGYRNWREDKGFATHVTALLGEAFYEQARTNPFHGLEIILARAEAEFLREARELRRPNL